MIKLIIQQTLIHGMHDTVKLIALKRKPSQGTIP